MPTATEPTGENFLDVFIGSIFISGASIGFFYVPVFRISFLFGVVGGLLAVAWLALFIHTVGKFGKRSLWLLFGAPPVAWVGYQFSPIACLLHHGCFV